MNKSKAVKYIEAQDHNKDNAATQDSQDLPFQIENTRSIEMVTSFCLVKEETKINFESNNHNTTAIEIKEKRTSTNSGRPAMDH